ncbi:MAG: diphosphomevalonate decarboxylase [Deltaproteobacteria bacterium]|nr:diphosphomevalonate decarboxylase [Deltaproteobacteria bacterium]
MRARALANVALVKYFGKRDTELNLPATGSLSLALEPLATTTEVSFDGSLESDVVTLNGLTAEQRFSERVSSFLDLLRDLASTADRARVETSNSFPTAAGLASSASGFAALALAGSAALDLTLGRDELSALARRGSGSAARSIPGGVALWQAGARADGTDSCARRIAGPGDLDLRMVIGVADTGPKPIGSTEAMELTRETSPYYGAWIESVEQDLPAAVSAVESRDLSRLGEIAESSALRMHAAALAASPGILFWSSTTVAALQLVRRLRAQGLGVWFTCDAGPQPKVLCSSSDEPAAARALGELPGIEQVIRCELGGGAELI